MAPSQVVPLARRNSRVVRQAFDQALQRNVTDAMAEESRWRPDGLLVPAGARRTARVTVREKQCYAGVPWFEAVMRRVDESIRVDGCIAKVRG